MKPVYTALLLVGSCRVLTAQAVELSGGSSTLYQSQGGTIRVRGANYEAQASAGILAGNFFAGAAFSKTHKRARLTVGSTAIPFNLPTDIFGGGHYLTAIGAGVDFGSVETTSSASSLSLFGGMSSQSFDSPFFAGARAEQPLVSVLLKRRLADGLLFSSRTLLTARPTTIQSLQWDPRKSLHFAASAGLGTSHPYVAASVVSSTRQFDLKAAYINGSSEFRRADVKVPLSAEPFGANLLFTMRPSRHISLTVGHESYRMPVFGATASVESSIDQIAATGDLAGTNLSGTLFRSSASGNGSTALVLSASRDFTSRLHAQATYLKSVPKAGNSTESFVTSLEEILSPRWSVSELMNMSNGQISAGFGGSLLSNFCTITASYQTYYLLQRPTKPFEQALILDSEIHPFGGVTFHAATFVAPTGRLLYTVAFSGLLLHNPTANSTSERDKFGPMVIRGKVIDHEGEPVEGAALAVDHVVLYTDSVGSFSLRERRAGSHTLLILTDQFLNGSAYRVISAPVEILSGDEKQQPDTLILVERITVHR